MIVFNANQISVGSSKDITLSAKTRSIEIVNMTHLLCQVQGDTDGLLVNLLPFCSKPVVTTTGQQLLFSLGVPIFEPSPQNGEYVEITESPVVIPGVMQPLANIPAYNTSTNIVGTVGTDVGYGMTRDLAGGIYYAQNTGITTISFNNIVTQVYLQNRSNTSGDITVTGDEDSTQEHQGITLSPGDAIGLSWRTQHLYLTGSAAQLPIQIHGWY